MLGALLSCFDSPLLVTMQACKRRVLQIPWEGRISTPERDCQAPGDQFNEVQWGMPTPPLGGASDIQGHGSGIPSSSNAT